MSGLRTTVLAVVVSLFAGAAAADTVTMKEYLNRVLGTHPFFKAEQFQPLIEVKNSDSYLGRQDWRALADARFTHLEPLQTSPFDPERIDIFAANAGTERLFWGSGSRLSLEWHSDVADQNLPGFSIPGPVDPIEIPIGPSTYYRNILTANWSLPLWQNRGGELDRLEHDLTLYDVDASIVTAWERQEDFLLEVGAVYLSWVLAEEQIRIAQQRLDLAVGELERSQRQRGAYLVDEVDVQRSRAAFYNTESALYLIESRLMSVRAELATLAGDTSIYRMQPDYDLYDLPEPPEIHSFVDTITSQSRLVMALELQQDQLARLERGYDDTKSPELALNLRGALMGGDDSFGGAFEMTNPDLGVGLIFSYPIQNRTASADVEKTRLQIRQLEESLKAVKVTLTASARAIIVRMTKLQAAIESNVEAIESNERRTEEEIKLYEQGRGDLAFVIQAQDNIALSQLEYAANLATYHNLALQLEALRDRLLPTPPDQRVALENNKQ